MDIGPITIKQCQDVVAYQVDFDLKQQSHSLWFELNLPGALWPSESGDAAMLALLLPAMLANENIHVRGRVSAQLLFHLNGAYQTLVRQVIPYLHQIYISADSCCDRSSQAKGVATGFSAGVDSFCSLRDYYSEQTPDALKITHLLYNNVGSHGHGADKEQLFHARYDRLKKTADELALPFIMINSNLNEFYGKGLNFQLTHTIRNASVALLLQEHIGHFLYSSAYVYADLFVGPSYDMAYSDTYSLPLLSTESLICHSVGSEYTRVEKTKRVAELPASYKVLDVCVVADNAENCSQCEKCLRTLFTLDMLGKLELYQHCFNLERYQQHRAGFIRDMLISDDPLLKEILDWTKQHHFRIEKTHYFAALLLYMRRFPLLFLHRLKIFTKRHLVSMGLYQPKSY
ncbi:hypothetical protein [Agarivorans sp. QJM3NY_33]|uniref:hypothetical protein n=1 Tax=Agarivorans sp. QJM3NY_33 TaxID=3421432 RepID=UPI003D7EAF03